MVVFTICKTIVKLQTKYTVFSKYVPPSIMRGVLRRHGVELHGQTNDVTISEKDIPVFKKLVQEQMRNQIP
jgi:hypothetical protein